MKSLIEWTNMTWNPVTGCTKVSPGCQHCYAERMSGRLQAMGQHRYRYGFQVTLHHEAVALPLRWRQPQMVFVNSMGDLFHEAVPENFIVDVFRTMAQARQHTFQVLTKRAERLASVAPGLDWPDNVWMGVSVENQRFADRLECLQTVPAAVRFVSLEPLLGPVYDLPLAYLDWVIVGGESGPGARPMRAEWARSIRDRCIAAEVPFFFKQWGGTRRTAAGRLLDGTLWDEYPVPRVPRVAEG